MTPAFTDLPFPEGFDIFGLGDKTVITFRGRLIDRYPTFSAGARDFTRLRQLYAVLGDLNANDNWRV